MRDPKVSHFFQEKRWKSGTLWEDLPKRHHFWTIIKQEMKKVGHFGPQSLGRDTLGSIYLHPFKRKYLKKKYIFRKHEPILVW